MNPADGTEFPDYDWLIGNHSDELTPWIPLMARRCKQSYFLLPCCPWDFYSKFQRQHGGTLSVYSHYLKYIEELGSKIGFQVQRDRLKIPSTRRTCFIGTKNKNVDYNSSLATIKDLLSSKKPLQMSTKSENCNDGKKMKCEFVPRPSVPRARNCTQLSVEFKNHLIAIIVDKLLSQTNESTMTWNQGKLLSLKEVADLCSSEDKIKLKKECGGIQTFLKNHHYIFHVENGAVKLKYPEVLDYSKLSPNSNKFLYWRTKICWFYENHPQGCPLSSDACSFAHGPQFIKSQSDNIDRIS